jgi:integrase
MDAQPGQPPKLLDRVRLLIRARHYSRRTEEAYTSWVRQYILFHHRRHPKDLGTSEVGQFLAWLATERQVASPTQNQALSALLFLYKEVLGIELGDLAAVPRAKSSTHVPVVLSVAEVRAVLSQLEGVSGLIASLLYGAGLRLQECLELRVKDVDFDRREITVRRGKGQKDRRVMLPDSIRDRLEAHLAEARRTHERDLATGFGQVVLPDALERKFQMHRRSGGGSSSSRPRESAGMRASGRRRVFICTSRLSSARSRKPHGGRALPSESRATPSAIHLRHTCSRADPISGQCRSSSATRTSARQWCTRTY